METLLRFDHTEENQVYAFSCCLTGNEYEAPEYIKELSKEKLSQLFKASKQLSDLCWQEIRRRRDG